MIRRHLLLATTVPALAAAQAPAPRADSVRAGDAAHASRIPLLVAGGVGAAAGGQLLLSPAAWPRTAGGFGRRLADQAGFIVVEESLRAGAIALTGLRTDERPCARAVASLVPCATLRVLTARDRAGAVRPNIPLVAGLVGATAASLAWRPEGRDGGKAAAFVATRLAISFGAYVAVRVVREWRHPDPGVSSHHGTPGGTPETVETREP